MTRYILNYQTSRSYSRVHLTFKKKTLVECSVCVCVCYKNNERNPQKTPPFWPVSLCPCQNYNYRSRTLRTIIARDVLLRTPRSPVFELFDGVKKCNFTFYFNITLRSNFIRIFKIIFFPQNRRVFNNNKNTVERTPPYYNDHLHTKSFRSQTPYPARLIESRVCHISVPQLREPVENRYERNGRRRRRRRLGDVFLLLHRRSTLPRSLLSRPKFPFLNWNCITLALTIINTVIYYLRILLSETCSPY